MTTLLSDQPGAATSAAPSPIQINEEQSRYWNDTAGQRWVLDQERIDAAFEPLLGALLERAAPRPGENVLDVGCGTATTTALVARRVSPGGSVVGIDLSLPMLEAARARADLRGLEVELRWADAQTAALEAEHYDLVLSRFGVMFFDDPTAAMLNLRRATRPGGRLVFVCWQSRQANHWKSLPLEAVERHLRADPVDPTVPGPDSLADPHRIAAILAAAGWRAVSIEPVEVPLRMGDGSVEDTLAFLLGIGPVASLLKRTESAALRRQAIEALRRRLRQEAKELQLQLGAACWLVSGMA